MRGVCIDTMNRPPKEVQLRQLGATGVRLELRHDQICYDYINKTNLDMAYLIGPSTEEIHPELVKPPKFWIIGNEPDGGSWQMTIGEYIEFYNKTVDQLPEDAVICAAGMVSKTPWFLSECWQFLKRPPNLSNKHYPQNAKEIIDFSIAFRIPVVIGEDSCEGCSTKTFIEWQSTVQRYSAHSFYFCWADYMINNMGLYSAANRPKKEYFRYKTALRVA